MRRMAYLEDARNATLGPSPLLSNC